MSKNKTTPQPTKTEVSANTKVELVAANENTALANIDLEADAQEFQDNYQRTDFAIPFLRVLQSNSPEVKKADAKYIEGAEEGSFFDTVTKEVLCDGTKAALILVPVHYRYTYVEYKLREEGGGFVKDHGLLAGAQLMQSAQKDERGRMILPNGNQLVETMQYAVLYLTSNDEDGTVEPHQALFTLASTQLRKGRAWNSKIDGLRIKQREKMLRPPMFYMSYALTCVSEKNEKGSWWGYKIESYLPVPELPNGGDIYIMARNMRQQIQAGEINLEGRVEVAQGAGENEAGSGEPTPF